MKKIICDDTGEEFIKYSAYMNSEHWQLKKKAFKECKLFKGCCQICSEKDNLHIHHKSYTRLGKEYLSDLVALCESCHFKLHELLDESDKHGKAYHQTLIRKLRKKNNKKNKKPTGKKKLTKKQKSNKEFLAKNYT